jgi:hypothetical protein
MRTHWFLLTAAAAVLGCAPASAQGGSRDVGYGGVPPQAYPARGMCRIWLDGLAANQQPPVTDCATARRGAQSQIRVLDGNEARDVAGGWRSENDCRDRNRDGRCDWTSDPRNNSIGSGPMPLMESAVAYARNRSVSDDVRRWVPTSATRVTLQNRPGTNQLYRALWIDTDGKPVQGWVDRKGDGSADLIERYADGKMVETTDGGALQR